jgi:hypothetical protein
MATRRLASRATGVVATILLLAACAPAEGRGPQPIIGWSVDDDVVHLWVDTCNGDPEAKVVESETTVTIAVTSTRRSPGDDCQDSLAVTLEAPLGGRTLIDKATGGQPEPLEG